MAELHALRARFAFAQGDPHAALAMAAPVEADACAPDAARVRAAVAMAEALAVCGRRDEAVAVARRWEPASQRQLAGAQALAHWLAGSLEEAAYEAERAYAAATDAQGWAVAALLLGHVWLSRGDTDAALRWFRESSVLLRGSDPVGMRPAALAGIAQAAAQAGDAAHAQAAIAELDRMPQPAGRGVGEELGLARAWTAHVSGDRARADRDRDRGPRRRRSPRRRRLRRPRPRRAHPPFLRGSTPQHCKRRCRAKRIVKGSDPSS